MRNIKESIRKKISLEAKYDNKPELLKKSNESFELLIPLLINDINGQLIKNYKEENAKNICPENKDQSDKLEQYSKYERKFLSFNQFVIDFRFISVYLYIFIYIRKYKVIFQMIRKRRQGY